MSNTNIASRRAYEKRTMQHFDRLPKSVRAAVAGARFDWTVSPFLRAFEHGTMTADELVAHIKQIDLIESAKTRFRAWGGEYPILPGELARVHVTKKARRR